MSWRTRRSKDNDSVDGSDKNTNMPLLDAINVEVQGRENEDTNDGCSQIDELLEKS